MGSLALTGHIVKSFLTLDACSVKFDCSTNFAQLFPDVAAAFADGSLRRLDTYKDMQPGEFLNVAATRVQHRLCDFEARSAQARILEMIAEADDKAFFLSGGEEGAYWLMNPGSFKSRARPVRTSSLTLRILSSVRTTQLASPGFAPRSR